MKITFCLVGLLLTLAQAPATKAPAEFKVRLDTSKGPIVIAVHRDWAPYGVDRFYELVTSGYYDDARVFRIRKATWAQFGIAGDPKVAQAWRNRTIPDDPWKGVSNKRGTIAYAFKDPNGRTTQVFINLKDNSATHDKEPFIVFGEVIEGMDVADGWYADYGESAGGGIRAGHQDPVFEGGNEYLKKNFPLLDYIKKAIVEDPADDVIPQGASTASEPRERSAPAKRRARERVGESEGRSPSDH